MTMARFIFDGFIFDREYLWERFDNDEGEGETVRLRREYKLFPRIEVDKWDDYDFVQRFRLSKGTTMRVLEMIRTDLEFGSEW